jgi:hypothetical protein
LGRDGEGNLEGERMERVLRRVEYWVPQGCPYDGCKLCMLGRREEVAWGLMVGWISYGRTIYEIFLFKEIFGLPSEKRKLGRSTNVGPMVKLVITFASQILAGCDRERP